MVEEQRSINKHDIFGLEIDGDFQHPDYEDSETNPFANFLREITDSLDGLAEFEHFNPFWDRPGYTLGRSEAAALVGNNERAIDHIVGGSAPLHEVPKEVREAGQEAFASWAIERGEAVLDSMFKDMNLQIFGDDDE
jgi:hypothetical protein